MTLGDVQTTAGHGVLGSNHDKMHIPPRLEDLDVCCGDDVCTIEWSYPMRLAIFLLICVDGHEALLHTKILPRWVSTCGCIGCHNLGGSAYNFPKPLLQCTRSRSFGAPSGRGSRSAAAASFKPWCKVGCSGNAPLRQIAVLLHLLLACYFWVTTPALARAERKSCWGYVSVRRALQSAPTTM